MAILFFKNLPFVLALYLLWTGNWKEERVKEDIPSREFKGCEYPEGLVRSIFWRVELEDLIVSTLIAIVTSASVLASRGHFIYAILVLVMGVVVNDLLQRFNRLWRKYLPSDKDGFPKLRLRRELWVKLLGSILIIVSGIISWAA